MNTLLIGNIIALLASTLMIIASYLKNKRNILLVQTGQMILFVLCNIVLGGITGIIINTASVIRNFLVLNNKLTKTSILIISIIMTILCLIYNNLGLVGLLPLLATLIYTIFINTKSTIKLKSLILITLICWGIYDFTIKSYISVIFNMTGVVASIISIYQLLRNNKEYKF